MNIMFDLVNMIAAKKLLSILTCTGTVGISGHHAIMAEKSREPEFHSLNDSDFKNELQNYSQGLGKAGNNASKLASKLASKDIKNQPWWEWMYKFRLLPEQKSGSNDLHIEFQNVKWGYSQDSVSSLSLHVVCADNYQKVFSAPNNSENNRLLKNIEKFCTKGGKMSLETV